MGSLPSAVGARDQAWRLRALVQSLAGEQAPAPAVATARARSVPVVAIASGKGGVGKTNLAVNLAIALSRRGVRATLLDADLGMANADLLCGLTPSRRLDDMLTGDGVAIESCVVEAPGGFLLVPGAVGVARVADLDPERRSVLIEQLVRLESRTDLILVDTGAGIGRDVLAFAQASDWLVTVVTPEPTSVTDAYGLIKCVVTRARERGERPPRVALAANLASNNGEARRVVARVGACCQRFLGFEPVSLGGVRHDQDVGRAVRRGSPLLLDSPRSRAAKDIREVSVRLAESLRL